MMKQAKVMEVSHKVAKKLVEKTGNYAIALKFAMKYVWGIVRKGKMRIGAKTIARIVSTLSRPRVEPNTDGVPHWIIEKNLSQEEAYAVRCECYKTRVMKETKKAVNVMFCTNYGNVFMWCPKSVLVG